MHSSLPVLGLAASSGTGKTTLLEQVIPLLTRQGLRVALVKHAHHETSVDQPGKDSYRLRAAGAATVVLATATQRIVLHSRPQAMEPDLASELAAIDPAEHDVVLVEGFKQSAFPKLELHRSGLDQALRFEHDPHIIAIATDDPASLPPTRHLPVLDINDPAQIAGFMADFFQVQRP
jgi:molybdopterin-guanine dinucleotide biosynthesis protein MobB